MKCKLKLIDSTQTQPLGANSSDVMKNTAKVVLIFPGTEYEMEIIVSVLNRAQQETAVSFSKGIIGFQWYSCSFI